MHPNVFSHLPAYALRTLILIVSFGIAMKIGQIVVHHRKGLIVSNAYIAAFALTATAFIVWVRFIESVLLTVLVSAGLFAAFWVLRILKASQAGSGRSYTSSHLRVARP